MHAIITTILCVLAAGPTSQPAPVRVTGIQAACRNGQTFVTWKDAAEGEAGAAFRYSLYRSDTPITPETLGEAELCYHGVLNNSAKLFGWTYFMKDRLDPSLPTAVIEDGGRPLPMWSGVAVRTVPRPGRSYYAVVATDEKYQPLSRVEPGESATTEPVDEQVAPIQPIKQADSKTRSPGGVISGKAGLPLMVSLHASSSRGAAPGASGDLYLYFGTAAMGWRDGLPGVFTVHESAGQLVLTPKDHIENPAGNGRIETCWFGYLCIPHGADHAEPRVYPFTERRLDWTLRWVMDRYQADPKRVYSVGQSMGGMGSTQFAFRRPDLFAAVYPRLQRVRQTWLPAVLPAVTSLNKGRYDKPTPLADGMTDYFDHMDSVKWVRGQHGDLPFYAFCCGRNDWVEPWGAYIEMVQALTANRHGFAMAWANSGHDNETPKVMRHVNRYYSADKFALDRSYPAFGNSSIDDDLGSGERVEQVVNGKKVMVLKDGAPTGGVNLGFIWSDVVDEPERWSVKLSNDLAKEEMTVDVTPRRCQKFKPKPGETFAWTNSAGGSGEVAADEWGLVTVPKVVIQPGEATVLTIAVRARPSP